MTLPKSQKVRVPPIKTQGIKTKLVPFILGSIKWEGRGRFIEPFLGSGVVALNVAPERALLSDTNSHIIRFYQGIQSGEITPERAKRHLFTEGDILRAEGKEHYYKIRQRFNDEADPLDFLFLTRSCFNGVMRFNSKGGFNVPFCHKPDRFRQAYVTKICNQIEWVQAVMKGKDWEFVCQDWTETLRDVADDDFVYVDPPYFGRHTDYFNSWSEEDADALAARLNEIRGGFAFSMWLKNQYRENTKVAEWFPDKEVLTQSHFYHVGSSENLRNEMEEALVVSPGYVADEDAETEGTETASAIAEENQIELSL